VAPGWEVVDDRLADQLLVQQPPQHIGTEKPLDVPEVEPGERPEGAVRSHSSNSLSGCVPFSEWQEDDQAILWLPSAGAD
jgi:hypothetical protein